MATDDYSPMNNYIPEIGQPISRVLRIPGILCTADCYEHAKSVKQEARHEPADPKSMPVHSLTPSELNALFIHG